MKIVYIVRKNCFGEFAQGESLALYAKRRGDKNIFVSNDQRLLSIAKEDGFEGILTKNKIETEKTIRQLKPDVLFLCNSKTVFEYGMGPILDINRLLGVYTCSLDSNWLFLKEHLKDRKSHYRVPEWIDRIYVVMSEKIYKLGLIENGGHYKISENYKKKIFCPGFILSGQKINSAKKREVRGELKLKKNEKLIFFYFGWLEDLLFPKFFPKLKKAIKKFEKEGKEIKVLFKARRKQKIKENWLIQKTWVTTEEYDNYVASSDLVIQHHGLGTLPKVIHNQVPAICLVPEIKKDLPYYKHSEFYEIEPFQKLGLCYSLSYVVSSQKLKQNMESLLYNKKEMKEMKTAQRKYFKKGEENLYNDLARHL